MRRPSRTAQLLRNRVVLGAVIAAVAAVCVWVSYGAQKGLPGQKIYHVYVEVPDAKQLSPGDQVRIGGARVGIVAKISAERPGKPFAKIKLSIFGKRTLPVDSRASVTPISILGGKSIQITRGRDERQLRDGATIPLRQSDPTVDLNDALETFDTRTRKGLRGLIGGAGDALSGRGADVNETIAEIKPLLPPLRRVLEVVADPATDVPGFVAGATATMQALQPVAGLFPQMLTDAADTAAAINAADPALGQVIDRLPGAEEQSTRTLTRATPVLSDLAALTRELRPATARLKRTVTRVDATLKAGPKTLDLARSAAPGTQSVANALLKSVPPKSTELRDSLVGLDATVKTVSSLLSVLGVAQERCNVIGIAIRNNQQVISEGDASGGWINLIPLFVTPETLLRGGNDENTHRNYQPVADDRGCSFGKEKYTPGVRQEGNPAEITKSYEPSFAPSVATERGKAAGLLTPTPGTRLP